MTNFEYYKTFEKAVNAYEKERGELVYNVHDGVSAGRFIHWLYEENNSDKGTEMNDKDVKNKERFSSSKQVSEILSKMLDSVMEYRSKSHLNENEYECLLRFISQLKTLDVVPNLNYQSIYDEALEMASTLNEIEKETHDCAMCGGREDCGYSTDTYLSKICRILYSSIGYHYSDKYNMKKMAKENKGE